MSMETGNGTHTNFPDSIQICEHLLNAGQTLYGQRHGMADRLCQEVARSTQALGDMSLQWKRGGSMQGGS